jgi:hypothetical protein
LFPAKKTLCSTEKPEMESWPAVVDIGVSDTTALLIRNVTQLKMRADVADGGMSADMSPDAAPHRYNLHIKGHRNYSYTGLV